MLTFWLSLLQLLCILLRSLEAFLNQLQVGSRRFAAGFLFLLEHMQDENRRLKPDRVDRSEGTAAVRFDDRGGSIP